MRPLLLILVVACGSVPAPAPNVAPVEPRALEVPMSDPAEYAIERITRDAGKVIFERTGIGDPYRAGMPYPMFLALLKAYPKTFGATTGELAQRFGFLARDPNPNSEDLDLREGLPIGMHLTVDPITNVPFVVSNCTLCHAERVQWPFGEALVIGLGNRRVRIHDYDAAFAAITQQPGFSAERLGRLADDAARERKLTWPAEFRALLVGATLGELVKRAAARADLRAHTAHNPPGRVATIESFAFILGQLTRTPVTYADVVGWAKVPDVIGYAQRTSLSWDGSGEGPVDLLAVEADVATGVRIEWLERHPFQGASLGAYLRQPPKRPAFPGHIEFPRAKRGRVMFEDHCSDCHGHYAPDGRVIDYDEPIVPIEDLGTDPARMRAITDSFERAANDPKLTRGYTKLRRSTGYIPPILTNVWARAPYGHVAQWPSLAVLAMPPDKRPVAFVTDVDGVYDLVAVGMPWQAAPAPGFVHDSATPGFSVLGHPFLAELGPEARADVIEYLKTL